MQLRWYGWTIKLNLMLQVNYCEIVVHFFHISHNLTWCSTFVHKVTKIYPVCSTYELTKQFMWICVKNCAIDLKKNNLYLLFLCLQNSYWFECGCAACTSNWTYFLKLPRDYFKLSGAHFKYKRCNRKQLQKDVDKLKKRIRTVCWERF